MSPLNELKRRNVIRMAGLYLVGAWLLVQVAGGCGYSKRSVRWRSVCHQSRWWRYQSTVAAMPSCAV